MHIIAIKKPGTKPTIAFFKTDPPLTDAIFQRFLEESPSYHLADRWALQDGLLVADFTSNGVPDGSVIESINELLSRSETIVQRREQKATEDLANYQQTLSESTGLPLED